MLPQFFDFNRTCPCCGEPLHLYMRWLGSMLFIGSLEETNQFVFKPTMLAESKGTNYHDNNSKFENEAILIETGETLKTSFTSNELQNESKKHQMYFFFICDKRAVKRTVSDWQISAFKSCYYRSTPFYEMKKDEQDIWKLSITDKEQVAFTNKDELAAFKVKEPGVDKVYIFNMDYVASKTTLWFYTVTPEQRKTVNFKPKILTEEIKALGKRPDFSPENREKLIDRFNSWIIMS